MVPELADEAKQRQESANVSLETVMARKLTPVIQSAPVAGFLCILTSSGPAVRHEIRPMNQMEHSRSTTPLSAANTANPISVHFEELKREMAGFLEVFSHWVDRRRRALSDDKEQHAKVLGEQREATEALKRHYQQLQQKRQEITNGTLSACRLSMV